MYVAIRLFCVSGIQPKEPQSAHLYSAIECRAASQTTLLFYSIQCLRTQSLCMVEKTHGIRERPYM